MTFDKSMIHAVCFVVIWFQKENFQVYECYCQNKPRSESLWKQFSDCAFFQVLNQFVLMEFYQVFEIWLDFILLTAGDYRLLTIYDISCKMTLNF